MVKQTCNYYDRPEGLRYIPCPSKTPIPRKERRHDFPFKEELDKIKMETLKNMINTTAVRNEFRLMGLIGFAKKPYEGLPYIIIPGNKFNRIQMNTLKIDDNMEDRKNMTKKQILMLERQLKKDERKNLGNLNEWDKKYIYKPPAQSANPVQNNNNSQEQSQPNPAL